MEIPAPVDRELRQRLWPWIDARWIVYEDDDLLAIDKPCGVPTQKVRPDAEDDLPHRLRRFLACRDPGAERADAYVGVHQRLDAETSGILLYAKRREANGPLAAQFEGRAVRKTYLAAVEGWRHGARVTFRDPIGPLRRGRVQIDRAGRPAITHARLLERRGTRALLEISIETGRTHQIRVHLAHHGSPVAGDPIYGGAPAPRLMLHASELTLAHPRDGRPLSLRAPLPPAFEAWLDARPIPLAQALEVALQRRFGLARAALREPPTTAFRLVSEEGDGLPGIAVDVYGDWAVLHVLDAEEAAVADALDRLGFAGVYVKRRPRRANTIDDAARARLAPAQPIRGRPAPDEFVVYEHGLPFLVRLGDGMSTGIFLDQRDNRARVRRASAGARVLNLFAYTCGFTVAAVAGGARQSVSVDASAVALDRGRANLALVGADPEAHRTVKADVFEWLDRARRRGERFDVVCCDPPTYSTGARGRWTSGPRWRELAAACFAVLAEGGLLLATSNDRRMSRAAFRAYLSQAARAAQVPVATLHEHAPPPDFRAIAGAEPASKTLLARRA